MVKNIDGYLLTVYQKKIHREGAAFFIGQNMQDYIKPTKGDSDPSMHMLQAGTNDLSLEDIPKAIFE